MFSENPRFECERVITAAESPYRQILFLVVDGPPPFLESRRIPSFGVPYTPKCLEWAFEIPIRPHNLM